MEKDEVEFFVYKLIQSIWENQEINKLDHFYAPEVLGYYNQDRVDFESLKNKVNIFQLHMKELEVEVLHLVTERDKFALHANQRLTSEGGKELVIPSILFAHLKEGRIFQYWLKTKIPFDFG